MTFDSKAMFFIASTAAEIRAEGRKYAQGLPSPCMSVCRMDEASGWCQGCLRTIDEICAWGKADEVFKRHIWMAIEARVAPLQAAAADDFFGAAP
jgi:predicted Fe-S protein YdhL (DUF1289 family)